METATRSISAKIAGLPIRIAAPVGASFFDDRYSLFLDPAARGGSHLGEIDIIQGAIPEEFSRSWKPENVYYDNQLLWSVTRTGSQEWPYHYGPSFMKPAEPPMPHWLVSRDLLRFRVYLDHDSFDPIQKAYFYPADELLNKHFIAANRGTVVHSSGVGIGDKCYLFLGDSEAGKSTIAEIFEKELGGGRIYSDDRMILREHEDRSWSVYGTPWHGTFRRVRPDGMPVGGLFFLEKGNETKLDPLSPNEALDRLMKVALGPWWLPEIATQQIKLLGEFVREFGRSDLPPNFSEIAVGGK